MEDHKLQALHDTLSKLRGRHGLGTSSLYSWQRNSSQGAAAKTPPSGSGGNPLHAHYHREGEHPHRSLARGGGDGRVIKRDFKDLDEPDRSSPVGDDGRKGKKKRRNEEDEEEGDNNNKKKSKEEKKREKKAARKAAKLEMKRQAKLEEKRREKRAAKSKQESSPLDKSAEAVEVSGTTVAKSQPTSLGGDRPRSKEKKRKEGKKKSERKEKKRQRPEEQSAGESSSPASLLAQPPVPGASKKKKKRKVSR